jgi:DNA-binding NarL/FixJ family response regulator
MGGAPDVNIRLVLADDHALIRLALERLFAGEADLEVLGSFSDGLSAAEFVEEHEPDILILDQQMPSLDGLGVVQRLTDSGCVTKVVMLVGGLSDRELVQAIQLGVRGLLWKTAALDSIADCVRSVHVGQICIGPREMLRAFKSRSRFPKIGGQLTPRELEIAMLIGEGLHNRDIAERLRLTEGTVKVHLHNIYSKLGVDGRVSLLRQVVASESI